MAPAETVRDRPLYFSSSHRILDRSEQILLLVLAALLKFRIWPDQVSAANWFPLLILLSEGTVVLLVLFRRPTERISTNYRDWAVAFAGGLTPLLVGKGAPPLSAAGGVVLLMLGMTIHLWAKLSLLRSFGVVAADRGVKRGGLYAVVRHPMYAGYILTHVGYLLVAPSWWNLAVYCVAWALFVPRIFAEERVLQANAQYRDYMAHVRYRLLPGVF